MLQFAYNAYGFFDGYIFPVYTNVNIISAKDVGNNRTEIVYSFTLNRTCRYIMTNWYIGEPGQNSLKVLHNVVGDNNWLAEGETGTYKIIVNMSYNDFEHNSYAMAEHSCYGIGTFDIGLVTKTFYYKSSDKKSFMIKEE